jgi:hypothetical protein
MKSHFHAPNGPQAGSASGSFAAAGIAGIQPPGNFLLPQAACAFVEPFRWLDNAGTPPPGDPDESGHQARCIEAWVKTPRKGRPTGGAALSAHKWWRSPAMLEFPRGLVSARFALGRLRKPATCPAAPSSTDGAGCQDAAYQEMP